MGDAGAVLRKGSSEKLSALYRDLALSCGFIRGRAVDVTALPRVVSSVSEGDSPTQTREISRYAGTSPGRDPTEKPRSRCHLEAPFCVSTVDWGDSSVGWVWHRSLRDASPAWVGGVASMGLLARVGTRRRAPQNGKLSRMVTVILPLITLVLGFAASFCLELIRTRLTARTALEVRTAERHQAEQSDRVAFERDGLRVMHAAIHDLLDKVNAIAVATVKAGPAGLDWRESETGPELRAAAMHANVNCSHESALLLRPPVIDAVERLTTAAYPMYWTRESGSDPNHNKDFYSAVTATNQAIATRLRELYGFATSTT